ncbi:MAG: siphovirus Gp157 family protein [Oscillospiraceae bacterium]
MASLYQLTDEFLTVFNMLEDDEIDEQVITDTLESLEYEIEDKADGYAKIIKTLDNNAEGLKKEIERLTTRKQTLDNRSKFLKQTLENSMRAVGKLKFTTNLFSFNIQKNGGKRALVIDTEKIDDIPMDYRIKQDDKINNDKIREYFKENDIEKCDFAHLEPQGESLRIR